MSYLVAIPEYRFSRDVAHIFQVPIRHKNAAVVLLIDVFLGCEL